MSWAAINRGLVLYDMRQYDRAIRELDHAINAKPDYAPAFNVRGLAYAAIGETRRSLQDFDQAIQLDRQFCQGVRQSRQYPPEHAPLRSGARRLQRGGRAQSEGCLLALQPRPRPCGPWARRRRRSVDIARAKEIEPGIGP